MTTAISAIRKMSEIVVPQEETRFSTNIGGLDACLAESEDGPQGLQYGTSIMLAGMPGGGKSSMATIISSAQTGRDALYLSGEERPERVKARWNRLNLKDADPYIAPLRAVEDALEIIRDLSKVKPLGLVVVDSVQTLTLGGKRKYDAQLEAAEMLCGQVTSAGGSIILVSHVSKSGNDHAGAAALAHIVDIVLFVTANAKKSERLLEVRKNRMGRAGFQVPLNITVGGLSVGTPAALNGSQTGGSVAARNALEKAAEKAYELLMLGKHLNGYSCFEYGDGVSAGMWRGGLELATKRLIRDGYEVLEKKVKGRKGFELANPPLVDVDGKALEASSPTPAVPVKIDEGNNIVGIDGPVNDSMNFAYAQQPGAVVANGDKAKPAVALAVGVEASDVLPLELD